jgi:hypothetical protein
MGRTLQDQKLMAQGQISTCKAARESSEFRREENNTQKIINMEGDSLQTRTGKRSIASIRTEFSLSTTRRRNLFSNLMPKRNQILAEEQTEKGALT